MDLKLKANCQVTKSPRTYIVPHSSAWRQASHSLTFWGLCGWVVRSLSPHTNTYCFTKYFTDCGNLLYYNIIN